MKTQKYTDFNQPITDFLDTSVLTDKAKDLTEGDLYAIGWGHTNSRVDKLNIRDLRSIEDAKNSGDMVAGSCCCCCTPCCCTAVAVIKAA